MSLMFRRSLTGYRSTGSYVSGRWVVGGDTEFTLLASVQPVTAADLQFLPEGRRQNKALVLITDDDLHVFGVAGKNPDKVLYEGETFEVVAHSPWKNGIISHNKYIMVHLGQAVA